MSLLQMAFTGTFRAKDGSETDFCVTDGTARSALIALAAKTRSYPQTSLTYLIYYNNLYLTILMRSIRYGIEVSSLW